MYTTGLTDAVNLAHALLTARDDSDLQQQCIEDSFTKIYSKYGFEEANQEAITQTLEVIAEMVKVFRTGGIRIDAGNGPGSTDQLIQAAALDYAVENLDG